MSPGPIFEPEGAGKDWWGAARALFAAGFRAGDVVHNCLLISPHAGRLHHGIGRACARLRGDSRRHRQYRAAGRGDRAVQAERLYRHARFPEGSARRGGEGRQGRVVAQARPRVRRGTAGFAAAGTGGARRRGAPVLRHRRRRASSPTRARPRRTDRQRDADRRDRAARAPASRWRRATSARSSSRRSIPTIR